MTEARQLSPGAALFRTLSFRLRGEDAEALGARHLALGLACTWAVGIGRWWDDPGAGLLQHLGLGSVLYAFVLAAVLWLVLWPLAPRAVSYMGMLTFVTLTSPPAILYAVPVERLFDVRTAGQLNLWFLAVVATWRVLLLLRFFASVPSVGIVKGVLAGLLPLGAIVTALTALNLHRVVFSLMGSIAEQDRGAHDEAYGVLFGLTLLSTLVTPVLLVAYGIAALHSFKRRRERREAAGDPGVTG
jgi:hypothetical protein